MKISLIKCIPLLLFLSPGCKSQEQQLAYFQDNLTSLKKTNVYREVKLQLTDTIKSWIKSGITADGIPPLKADVKWKVDDGVFFNASRNKCILLLLEIDTRAESKIDDVQMILGYKENGRWNFFFDGLSTMMFPHEFMGLNRPLTFDELSYHGELEMVNGYYKKNSYAINDRLFERWDINELKKMHHKFLNTKDARPDKAM